MYKIKLPVFEGPFDLLLYFIKRDELNIYDIPISKITEEFLEYIRIMKLLDLDLAGEFIVMSSTLMQIKSQMLLPRFEDENGDPIEDPRTELVQRLIEYKQIKDGAEELKVLEDKNRFFIDRENFSFEENLAKQSNDGINVGLFDLINALNKIIKRKSSETVSHNVKLFNYSIEEERENILKEIKIKKNLSFIKFLEQAPKQKIVVCFLAILDLVRLKEIIISQNDSYDDIIITQTHNFN
jgi:segregation and condensation protein A